MDFMLIRLSNANDLIGCGGTISQSELCWVALTNQIHANVMGKILHGDAVMW